ncbi:MAG TPA: hypothetical protein VGN51_01135 [Acidimicrobiia bacterium]|jgi:uncharacterized membrane protein
MKRLDGWALALAAVLFGAGVAHFVAPDGFDAIVPHVLPGSERFWTTLSGVVELALAVGMVWPRTRRRAATLAAVFFVVVFPANIKDAVDASTRAATEFTLALLRLPLQIPLIWWAWHVRTRAERVEPSRRAVLPGPSSQETASGRPLE